MNPNSSAALRFGQRSQISGSPGLDLTSLDTTPLPDGCLVVVNAAPSTPDLFVLVKTDSTTPTDGSNVVAPVSGPGRWFRYSSVRGGAVALFGDGSDGDVVVSLPNTPVDDILNARTITILPGASIRVPNGDHCLLRANTFIRVDGPINGSATIAIGDLGDSVAVVQYVGATAEGGSGGSGAGGAGGGVNGSNGVIGQDGSGKASALGFSSGTGSTGGALGVGGAGIGGAGGNASVPTAGVDITDLADHLQLYPAGLAGTVHGSIPGFDGRDGVPGGAGGGGTGGGAGGLGGLGGKGGSMVLLVSPVIILNALVSSNGGNGGPAPNGLDPGAPTVGGDAALGSNAGGGGGGSGGGGGAGGAGGLVCVFYGDLVETVAPTANPGTGGAGAPGAAGGAGDGTGFAGGKGGDGATGASGSLGYVIRQRIW